MLEKLQKLRMSRLLFLLRPFLVGNHAEGQDAVLNQQRQDGFISSVTFLLVLLAFGGSLTLAQWTVPREDVHVIKPAVQICISVMFTGALCMVASMLMCTPLHVPQQGASTCISATSEDTNRGTGDVEAGRKSNTGSQLDGATNAYFNAESEAEAMVSFPDVTIVGGQTVPGAKMTRIDDVKYDVQSVERMWDDVGEEEDIIHCKPEASFKSVISTKEIYEAKTGKNRREKTQQTLVLL